MGGSCRQYLNTGMADSGFEGHLRLAAKELGFALSEAQNLAHEQDQTDNAADTGGLAGRLRLALYIITSELPDADRLCQCCMGQTVIRAGGYNSQVTRACPECTDHRGRAKPAEGPA